MQSRRRQSTIFADRNPLSLSLSPTMALLRHSSFAISARSFAIFADDEGPPHRCHQPEATVEGSRESEEMHRSDDEKRSTDMRKKRKSENLNGEKCSMITMKIARDRAKNRRRPCKKSPEITKKIKGTSRGNHRATCRHRILDLPAVVSSIVGLVIFYGENLFG